MCFFKGSTKSGFVNIRFLVLIGGFEKSLKKATIDEAQLRWIRKIPRSVQNLGGVLNFSDLLKSQEKTDIRWVPNIQKTYAVFSRIHGTNICIF